MSQDEPPLRSKRDVINRCLSLGRHYHGRSSSFILSSNLFAAGMVGLNLGFCDNDDDGTCCSDSNNKQELLAVVSL